MVESVGVIEGVLVVGFVEVIVDIMFIGIIFLVNNFKVFRDGVILKF